MEVIVCYKEEQKEHNRSHESDEEVIVCGDTDM
jgi:hypothetical protein